MQLKIISGGQTGIDVAALRAARTCGLAIGGVCPRGWRTESGPAPWLADYGLTEHESASYPPRTRVNVEKSHATLILADVSDHSQLKGGTKLTWDIALHRCKDGAGLFLADLRQPSMIADVVSWVRECMAAKPTLGGVPVFVLNVAGPRESGCPGIGARAEAFLVEVFKRLLERTS